MPEPPRPEDIDALMRALGVPAPAGERAPSAGPEAAATPAAAAPVPLEALTPSPGGRAEAGLELLNDVNVQVRIELGSARLSVQDVLKLGPGSVVGLESLVSEPVNVFVNDRLVARGEVLVVNDNFAVRITEVLPLPKTEP
jgi:flagellar motor switch protein FliN/FliY